MVFMKAKTQLPNPGHLHHNASNHPFLSFLRATGAILASATCLTIFTGKALAEPDALQKNTSSIAVAAPCEIPKPKGIELANRTTLYGSVTIYVVLTEWGFHMWQAAAREHINRALFPQPSKAAAKAPDFAISLMGLPLHVRVDPAVPGTVVRPKHAAPWAVFFHADLTLSQNGGR